MYIGTDLLPAKLSNTSTTFLQPHLGTQGPLIIPGLGSPFSMYLDDIRVYRGAGDLNFMEQVRLENVPEPSSVTLGAVGLAGWLRARRKR